ncbi:MAG: hypothetical protein WBB82_14850 [Limnothrix sp.]
MKLHQIIFLQISTVFLILTGITGLPQNTSAESVSLQSPLMADSIKSDGSGQPDPRNIRDGSLTELVSLQG